MVTLPGQWQRSLPALTLAVSLLANAGARDNGSLSGHGEPWTVAGKIRKGDDVSGAALLTAGSGYLVSDETRAVQPFRLDTAARIIRMGEPLNLLPGNKPELDLEAITAAPGESCYYTTGSHGVARKSGAVSPDRFWVFRLPADRATGRIDETRITRASLRPLIAADPVLKRSLDRPVEDGGLDIEGLAEKDGALWFGLRSPSVDGHTFVLEVNARRLFSGGPADLRRHELPLGTGRGVRDLAAVRRGFLLIAGAAHSGDGNASEAHGFALHFWSGPGFPPVEMGKIPAPPGGKAEGLLVLAEDESSISLLVFYDGAKNGAPTGFQIQKPMAP